MKPDWMPVTWFDRDTGRRFEYRHCWPYRTPEKESPPLGWAVRYQTAISDPDRSKLIIPFFRRGDHPDTFRAGAAVEPRPLFGLDTLARWDATGLVFIAEGEKDATALQMLGLAAVTNQGGSKAADRADWSPVKALPPAARVVVWPDDDEPGQALAVALVELLHGRPVEALATPPAGTPAEEGAGAADWLQQALAVRFCWDWDGLTPLPEDFTAGDIDELRGQLLERVGEVVGEIPAAWIEAHGPTEPAAGPVNRADPPMYIENGRGTFFLRQSNSEGLQEVQLSNFTARIAEERIRDDGVSTELELLVTGRRGGRTLQPVAVNWSEFTAMNWPVQWWGTATMIYPGQTIRERLRHGVQFLSNQGGEVPRRTVYTHTGWRKLEQGWTYLTAGAVIDAGGPVADIAVDLGELAGLYALPEPSSSEGERREAASASMAAGCMAPSSVMVPLVAAVYLAPLTQALSVDFALWLEGPSRSRKSSVAAAMAAHFGAGIERTRLPANWTDTPTTIEGKLFTLADALVVVDDYAPQPSKTAQQRLDASVHQLIRNLANGSSRGRSNADLTVRKARPARGLCLATAEQWPVGESITARLFGVTLRPGQVNLDRLSQAQDAAHDGRLARCMADYIQDLAREKGSRSDALRERWKVDRSTAREAGLQGRLPEQVAFLMAGYRAALDHWHGAGLLDDATRTELQARGWTVLVDLASTHEGRIQGAQPAEAFIMQLVDMLAAGDAHLLSSVDGTRPAEAPERFGWRGGMSGGRHLGWVSEEAREVYLLGSVTFEAVNDALKRSDTPLNLRPGALWRQLQLSGYLKPGEEVNREGRTVQRNTCRIMIDGRRVNVLVLDLEALEQSGDLAT